MQSTSRSVTPKREAYYYIILLALWSRSCSASKIFLITTAVIILICHHPSYMKGVHLHRLDHPIHPLSHFPPLMQCLKGSQLYKYIVVLTVTAPNFSFVRFPVSGNHRGYNLGSYFVRLGIFRACVPMYVQV